MYLRHCSNYLFLLLSRLPTTSLCPKCVVPEEEEKYATDRPPLQTSGRGHLKKKNDQTELVRMGAGLILSMLTVSSCPLRRIVK